MLIPTKLLTDDANSNLLTPALQWFTVNCRPESVLATSLQYFELPSCRLPNRATQKHLNPAPTLTLSTSILYVATVPAFRSPNHPAE
jgi:hypothetical protein